MELTLTGKTALITGGSHGIGFAIAKAFAQAGAEAIIVGRTLETLLNASGVLRNIHGAIHGFECDVTDPQSVKSLFERVRCTVGKLDILVNNAGGAEKFGAFLDLADEDWRVAYDLNFMSMVYCSREAIPMLKQAAEPRIINISSVPAHQPGFFNPHYSAAKAAMLNLSKHLANVLAKDKILVNAICPSTLKGGVCERNVRDRAARDGIPIEAAEHSVETEEQKKSPLGFVGTPEDVASLVVFLASSHANFLTGQCYNVDGGITRSIL